MSTHPRLEAKISALGRRQTNLETQVEEVTEDMTANLKHLSEDMEASFRQLTEYLMKTEEKNEERFSRLEALLIQVLARLPEKP